MYIVQYQQLQVPAIEHGGQINRRQPIACFEQTEMAIFKNVFNVLLPNS